MKWLIILLFILIINDLAISQEKRSRYVSGTVYDKDTKEPVKGVEVELLKFGKKTFTDSHGSFSIKVIKTSGKLKFSQPGYFSSDFSYRGPHYKGPHKIFLKPDYSVDQLRLIAVQRTIELDSTWKHLLQRHKNIIYFLPLELINGSVGLQYERMLGKRQSIGLHTSVYFRGRGYYINTPGNYQNHFNGYKVDLNYRNYLRTLSSCRIFIEGRLSGGYFDLHPLIYMLKPNTIGYNPSIGRNATFYTGGIGISFGWAILLPKLHNGIFNLTLGFQFIPFLAPATTEVGDQYHSETYYADKMWWVLGGPGSLPVIRLAYGGIF